MLITNANLITWDNPNRILMDHALCIQDGKIADVGPSKEMVIRYPESERLDAKYQYVLPGNICAHTHFYGAFARGMGIPGQAPDTFTGILEKLWWPLDLALDEDAVRYSALVCLVDAIRHGTTTLVDHHASPNVIPGTLDIIADAVDQSGLRAVLCYEVTDRNGVEGVKQGIRENLRFIQRTRQTLVAGGRVTGTFGLHASLTLSDRTLAACRQSVPDDVGFHIHVAEAEADQQDSLSKYGTRVVNRLQQFDMLGPNSIFVHAVHVDAVETDLLAESQTWVTHQPRSNMNNGVGIGDIEAMLKAGVKVCLGNDGFSNAMWEEWKTAYLVHKAWNRDPRRMSANDVVQMGVYNNAALVNHLFSQTKTGILEKGAAADIIFVDYQPYTPITESNLPWHIVFGFHESMVTTTIVDGKVLMDNREIVSLDVQKIMEQAMAIVPRVWDRYRLNVPL